MLGHWWSDITKSTLKRLTSNNFTFVLCIFFSNPMVKLHLFEPWKLRTKISTVRHHLVLGHWWSDLTQSTLKRLTSNKSLWHPWNQKVSTVKHHLVLGHLWSYITKSTLKRLTSNNFTFVLFICIFFYNPMVFKRIYFRWAGGNKLI